MLNPWALTRKNHTEYIQDLIGEEKRKHSDDVNMEEIIEYLKNVNGNYFGEKTFAPVYESGKSIKEIDLLWAPVIESMISLTLTRSRIFCFFVKNLSF